MILYFENSYNVRKEIGRPQNEQEINKIIQKFLKEHNYKSYYIRKWTENNETYYDVGSWGEFFVCVNEDLICDSCIYNPPSSCDGKPCTYCELNNSYLNCYQKQE